MNNNNQSNKDNDTRKIFTTLVLVLTLMIFTTGATYAYFAISDTNNNTVEGTAATTSLELTVTEATLGGTLSGTKSNVMVPQVNTYLETAMGANYKCVDANGNTVCKVYTVSVTNESSAAVRLNGTIQFLAPKSASAGSNKYTNLYWRKAESVTSLGNGGVDVQVTNSNDAAIISNTSATNCSPSGTYCSKIYDISAGSVCTVLSGTGCTRVSLSSGGSTTYYIVVWINETGGEQNDTDKGEWQAIIKFEGENGQGVTSTITSSS